MEEEEEEDEKEEKCAWVGSSQKNFPRDRKKCMAAIERMEKEEKRGPMKYKGKCTVGQNKKHRINSHPIIHCPTSEGLSEVCERVSAAEGASEASSPEQANE